MAAIRITDQNFRSDPGMAIFNESVSNQKNTQKNKMLITCRNCTERTSLADGSTCHRKHKIALYELLAALACKGARKTLVSAYGTLSPPNSFMNSQFIYAKGGGS